MKFILTEEVDITLEEIKLLGKIDKFSEYLDDDIPEENDLWSRGLLEVYYGESESYFKTTDNAKKILEEYEERTRVVL